MDNFKVNGTTPLSSVRQNSRFIRFIGVVCFFVSGAKFGRADHVQKQLRQIGATNFS